MPNTEYGVCKALDGQPVQGIGEIIEDYPDEIPDGFVREILKGNPACVCPTTDAAMVCPYGHLLECHYAMSCEEANCGHYLREKDL